MRILRFRTFYHAKIPKISTFDKNGRFIYSLLSIKNQSDFSEYGFKTERNDAEDGLAEDG